ncbi:MAG TPA: hypothetical protein VN811_06665, partial [Thermoanaerobaculia bacterium]|nr:hypothetical protein [Thermoanaerobaculia bacterium]
RDNNFWREVVDNCQSRPQVLDELRALESDYRGITTEQLSALAKTYFPRERASWIVVKPTAAPKATAPADAPAAGDKPGG